MGLTTIAVETLFCFKSEIMGDSHEIFLKIHFFSRLVLNSINSIFSLVPCISKFHVFDQSILFSNCCYDISKIPFPIPFPIFNGNHC